MAVWTAKVTDIKIDGAAFDVSYQILKDGVLFESGVLNSINPANSFYGFLQRRIDMLKAVDETDLESLKGDVDFSKATTLTDDQIYQKSRAELLQLKTDVDLGLATADDLKQKLDETLTLKQVTVSMIQSAIK